MTEEASTPPQEPLLYNSNGIRNVVLLILALIIFFITYSCFFQVKENQITILTQFEKPISFIKEPGLHFKWPWPIQRTYAFDLRTQLYLSPQYEVPSKDGKILILRSYAQWGISDVEVFRNRVGVNIEDGRSKIALALQNEMKASLSQFSFNDLLSADKSKGLALLEKQTRDILNQKTNQQYGISIYSLGIDRLELPEQTTKSVFERQKKVYERQSAKILQEADRKAKSIESEANLKRDKTIAEAEAEAKSIRGQADAEVFKHLDVYRKNPDLALFLRKLEAMEKTLATKTTLVLDRHTPPFDILVDREANLKNVNLKESSNK